MLGRRYLNPGEFGRYAAELRLVGNPFQERFLEFLERERLLAPVSRVRWPRAVVIAARGGTPSSPPTGEQVAASEALGEALRAWRRHGADLEAPHPLDYDDERWASLVNREPAATAFEEWASFATNVRAAGQPPLNVDGAVETYYHGWQALLLADVLDMGLNLVFDLRVPRLFEAALRGGPGALVDEPTWSSVSFEGCRGLMAAGAWLAHFDVVSRFAEARQRALNSADTVQRRGGWHLEGEALARYHQAETRAATASLAALHLEVNTLVSFIAWQSERWDEWTRRGRSGIAEEYRRHIHLTAECWMAASGRPFADLAAAVGRVTGHFTNTLDVIFPDWIVEARERTASSLKHSVLPALPKVEPALAPTLADIEDLLAWLDRHGERKLHLHIEAVLERQFSDDPVDRAALAKEAEGLASTFEHLVNILLTDGGLNPVGKTLIPKLLLLWVGVPDVQRIIQANTKLTKTKPPYTTAAQWDAIDGLARLGPTGEIAKTLLKIVLLRNDGLHNSMASWDGERLLDTVILMLSGLLFCRKALARLPTPTADSSTGGAWTSP
jgi:hypothetical protein